MEGLEYSPKHKQPLCPRDRTAWYCYKDIYIQCDLMWRLLFVTSEMYKFIDGIIVLRTSPIIFIFAVCIPTLISSFSRRASFQAPVRGYFPLRSRYFIYNFHYFSLLGIRWVNTLQCRDIRFKCKYGRFSIRLITDIHISVDDSDWLIVNTSEWISHYYRVVNTN